MEGNEGNTEGQAGRNTATEQQEKQREGGKEDRYRQEMGGLCTQRKETRGWMSYWLEDHLETLDIFSQQKA